MVLLSLVWNCFQDKNFHGVVVGLYEQSIESWVGLNWPSTRTIQPAYNFNSYNKKCQVLITKEVLQ